MRVGHNIGHVRADKPPSKHARAMLGMICGDPRPAQEVNFTVRDKLIQFGYVVMVDRPSPYKSHKPGRTVPFLVITDEGRAYLARPQ